jgi:RNA polymerase sigma-70 factor (ECF subfamily)
VGSNNNNPPPLKPLTILDKRHVAYVRTLVARLGVSPPHEREDLVQEVLIQAYRSRDSPLEPRALLFGITRHVVFRWVGRRSLEREVMQHGNEPTDGEDTAPSPEELRGQADRRELVHAAVEELPPLFRVVFIRADLEGEPMADVAKALNIPVNTGYTRLHLARARWVESVRRHLARRGLDADGV